MTWEPTVAPYIVCAANRLPEDGSIICGARHFDAVMHRQMQRDGRSAWRSSEQGFIDQFGRWYDREEARKIAEQMGQIRFPDGGGPLDLYSENLY